MLWGQPPLSGSKCAIFWPRQRHGFPVKTRARKACNDARLSPEWNWSEISSWSWPQGTRDSFLRTVYSAEPASGPLCSDKELFRWSRHMVQIRTGHPIPRRSGVCRPKPNFAGQGRRVSVPSILPGSTSDYNYRMDSASRQESAEMGQLSTAWLERRSHRTRYQRVTCGGRGQTGAVLTVARWGLQARPMGWQCLSFTAVLGQFWMFT